MMRPVQELSLSQCRQLFATLLPPSEAVRCGRFRAQFLGPWWLRLAAGPSIALSGLPGWQGKRFIAPDSATNCLRTRAGEREALSMQCVAESSLVDGRPGLSLRYGERGPIPWRWVRDELRAIDGDTWLCMTVIELPLLRALSFPFLLVRVK